MQSTFAKTQLSTGKIIYTDGGCHNEDGCDKGIGSWAFVEFNPNGENVNVYCGCVSDTTNNRTEMLAIINAIKAQNKGDQITIISDSGYVVKGYNHPAYLDRWMKNGWRTSTKSPVLNRDLWEQLVALTYQYGVKFKLIRGHYRDPDPIHAFWNSIVDRACTWMMQNHREDGLVILTFDIGSKKIIKMEEIK